MLNAIFKEVKRLWVFIAMAVVLLFVDPVAAKFVLFGIGCVSVVMMFAHLVRKLLHPYVDLEYLYQKASEQSMPAALVLAAFIYLVTTVLNVIVQFIK
jgi:hypothetical protein